MLKGTHIWITALGKLKFHSHTEFKSEVKFKLVYLIKLK